jgi:hypothetical protein
MIYNLEATDVGFIVEKFDGAYPDVFSGGFAGEFDENGYPTKYLTLQRCMGEDPDDDGYYVEWCDQSNSGYECIKSFELSRDKAKVVFEESAEFFIDTDDENSDKLAELIIQFSLDDDEFNELLSKLRDTIFLGYNVFSYQNN